MNRRRWVLTATLALVAIVVGVVVGVAVVRTRTADNRLFDQRYCALSGDPFDRAPRTGGICRDLLND